MDTTLPEYFNWKDYLNLNPDLTTGGINTREKAIIHFLNYGKNECRSYCSDEIRASLKDLSLDLKYSELEFYSNNLDCVALYLTSKEVFDGKFEILLGNLKTTTDYESSKEIDFLILLNNLECYDKVFNMTQNLKIFNKIKIINLDLEKSQDIYIRDHTSVNKEIPEYGYKSGPNIMFFKGCRVASNYNTTLFIETDCLFNFDWNKKIKQYVENSNGFWISGSCYDGDMFWVDSIGLTHLNGVGLYATGNKYFQKFLSYYENFFLNYVKLKPQIAYDYALRILINYFLKNNNFNYMLWKFINRNYINNQFIFNASLERDSHLSADKFEKIHNFYILHKKIKNIEKTIDVFISTFSEDSHILDYNLKFINKNLNGYRKIIVFAEDNIDIDIALRKQLDIEVVYYSKISFDLNRVAEEKFKNLKIEETYKSFILNQFAKFNWQKHTNASDVLFLNVNSMLIKPTNIFKNYFLNNKRILHKINYKYEENRIYKKSTDDFCGFSYDYFYNTKNFILNRKAVEEFIYFFEENHNVSIEDYFFDSSREIPFFENFFGAFVDKYYKNKEKYTLVEKFDSSNIANIPRSAPPSFCKELEKLL